MQALTKEQSKLVANNHNLIYSFLKSKHLIDEYSYKNNEDWYGVMAEALCQAAATFDQQQNCSFSTYAYVCMNNAMNVVFNAGRMQKRIPFEMIDYYSEEASRDSEDSKMDLIPSKIDVAKEAISNISLENLFQNQDSKHKKVYLFLLDGFSITEIANKLGVSKQSISQMIQRDRKRILYDV